MHFFMIAKKAALSTSLIAQLSKVIYVLLIMPYRSGRINGI